MDIVSPGTEDAPVDRKPDMLSLPCPENPNLVYELLSSNRSNAFYSIFLKSSGVVLCVTGVAKIFAALWAATLTLLFPQPEAVKSAKKWTSFQGPRPITHHVPRITFHVSRFTFHVSLDCTTLQRF
jgi:hypothetical protein